MEIRHSPWPSGPRDRETPARLPGTVRAILWGLVLAVLGLLITVAVLAAWVLNLKSLRDHAAEVQQQQIDSTFCQVLAQLPADSPELSRIRGQLACKQAGLSPAQMKQLAKTGGTH